jgi:hypothetical protein
MGVVPRLARYSLITKLSLRRRRRRRSCSPAQFQRQASFGPQRHSRHQFHSNSFGVRSVMVHFNRSRCLYSVVSSERSYQGSAQLNRIMLHLLHAFVRVLPPGARRGTPRTTGRHRRRRAANGSTGLSRRSWRWGSRSQLSRLGECWYRRKRWARVRPGEASSAGRRNPGWPGTAPPT